MKNTYINVTQEAGKAFFQRNIQGAVVMLNLLKFKEVADYSDYPELKPAEPISGAEAYSLYMEFTKPLLHKAGGAVLFYGTGGPFLIGPAEQHWDVAMLVRHASIEKFMAFAQDGVYLRTAGHRAAALEDSRLLPLEGNDDPSNF